MLCEVPEQLAQASAEPVMAMITADRARASYQRPISMRIKIAPPQTMLQCPRPSLCAAHTAHQLA